MNNRNEHVDVARGISILLIVIYHSKLGKLPDPRVIEALSLIRVPLFFFLSGVFFSYSLGLKEFVSKKSDALLKPYFVTLLGYLLISIWFDNRNILIDLIGIFYGVGNTIKWAALWFLAHLFALQCFCYIFYRTTGFDRLPYQVKCIFIAALLFAGASIISTFASVEVRAFNKIFKPVGLPFSLDLIPISAAFLMAGKMLREQVLNFTPQITSVCLAMLAFFGVAFFTNAHIDLSNRIIREPIHFVIGSISGIYLCVVLAWVISKTRVIKKPFIWSGRAAIFLLLFHEEAHNKTGSAVNSYVTRKDLMLIPYISAFVASLAIPLLIKWAAYKYKLVGMLYLPIRANKLAPSTVKAG